VQFSRPYTYRVVLSSLHLTCRSLVPIPTVQFSRPYTYRAVLSSLHLPCRCLVPIPTVQFSQCPVLPPQKTSVFLLVNHFNVKILFQFVEYSLILPIITIIIIINAV